MIQIDAVFNYRPDELIPRNCVVEEVIRLSGEEFDLFAAEPCGQWDFIRDNHQRLREDKTGIAHCLLVVGEGRMDGVLAYCDGHDFADYAAFLPNAQQLISMEQRYNCVQDLESALTDAADEVMSCALAYNGEGHFRTLVSDLADTHGFEQVYAPLLIRMLREHSNVSNAEICDDEIFVSVSPQAHLVAPAHVSDAWELAAWKKLAESNPAHWREDIRWRNHKDGVLYYLGGESGQYMRVAEDGALDVGTYEAAKPGIEDAVLTARHIHQLGSYEAAFALASSLGGARFAADIFAEVGAVAYAVEAQREAEQQGEKPSVLKQLQEAKQAPKPPRKVKEYNMNKGDVEI